MDTVDDDLPGHVRHGPGRPRAPGGAAESGLLGLEEAITAWVEHGRPGPIARWLERELDVEGIPRRLAVSHWAGGLRELVAAVGRRPGGWPDRFDARVEGWFRGLLRFSRPDGSTVFGGEGGPTASRGLLRSWAGRLSDPGLTTVLDWWFPPPARRRHAPPPLPADARPDRPLACLRADWTRDGDLVAVDHRGAGVVSRVEVFGHGRAWLGPAWASAVPGAPAAKARPSLWVTGGSADVFEWSFRVGKARVTRTAVLLRGRRLALLGEQWDGPGDPGAMRLGLADGVEARPVPDSRGLALVPDRGRASARVLPIGLPRRPYATDRGGLDCQGRELVLRLAGGPRAWRPLLVSWDPARDRRPAHWRALTVAEKSRARGPDAAFAARVSWGRDETLVIYRSLARPALRSFLGHQTRARFLIGLFSAEGDVEPLVKVDE